ncbi:hypothetical protein FRC11_005717 [Ceratobasidium sp. 423]|nr:hypothetical protein FRC11_005717 [Ceratobasidium sp. 423]
MMANTDRILDLDYWGSADDGTPIHGAGRTGHTLARHPTQHMAWRFEHINNETGDEKPDSTQIQEELSRAQKMIQTQATEIEFLRKLDLEGRQEATSVSSRYTSR